MKTMIQSSNKVDAFEAAVVAMMVAFREAYEDLKANRRKGGVLKRSFEDVISGVGYPKPLQAIFDSNPVVAVEAIARLRRPMTALEALAVQESDEVKYQGVLSNGEPAQVERMIQSPYVTDETLSVAENFATEAKLLAELAQVVAQRTKETFYVRYVPNAVIRDFRNQGKGALRAIRGGRSYASNVAEHDGTLLAIVMPNAGERTAKAKILPQVSGIWTALDLE